MTVTFAKPWYRDMICSECGQPYYGHCNSRYCSKACHAVNDRDRAYIERKRNAEGSFTREEWKALVNKYDYKCLGCGATDEVLHADHVKPLAKGGTDYITNIQPLCKSCNSSKRDMVIDYRPQLAG